MSSRAGSATSSSSSSSSSVGASSSMLSAPSGCAPLRPASGSGAAECFLLRGARARASPPGAPGSIPSGSASGGPFRALPTEILHGLFSYLPLPDIGNLALSSDFMRRTVEEWSATAACVRRVAGDRDGEEQEQEDKDKASPNAGGGREGGFRKAKAATRRHRGFAVLVKRLTCLQSTQERVRVAFAAFDRILSDKLPAQAAGASGGSTMMDCSDASSAKSADWRATLYTIRFSVMLHVFTRGWDESEYPTLVAAVDKKFGLEPRLRRFLLCTHRHDVCVSSEMHIRLTLRCLTWDFAGSDYGHRANWLLAMLKKLVGSSPESQALIFFLLFGPYCQDGQTHHDNPQAICEGYRLVMTEINNHADWEAFVDNSADDFHEGKDMFYTLAQAVCSCMTAVKMWKEELLVPVLDQLFRTPSPWKRENVAGFLLFCSEKLIMEYLQRKLDGAAKGFAPGNVTLVARLLIDMIVISYRFDNELSRERGIGKIFDAICEYPKPGEPRQRLFESVWQSLVEEIDQREMDTEEDDLLEVLQGFGTHIMLRAYVADGPTAKARATARAAGDDEDDDDGSKTEDTLPLESDDEDMMMEE